MAMQKARSLISNLNSVSKENNYFLSIWAKQLVKVSSKLNMNSVSLEKMSAVKKR